MIRAVTDVPDTYRFATTGPYYVEIGDQPRISKASAQFFLDWVTERTQNLKLEDADEREAVLKYHRQARDFWQDLVEQGERGVIGRVEDQPAAMRCMLRLLKFPSPADSGNRGPWCDGSAWRSPAGGACIDCGGSSATRAR